MAPNLQPLPGITTESSWRPGSDVRYPSPRYVVTLVFPLAGVDRPHGCSYSCGYGEDGKRLAERLTRAIAAGVVVTDARIATDINGKTYVAHGFNVLMRHADRDLRALGF